MGLHRYFEISVTDRDGNEIFDPDLAERAQEAIEEKYDWWEGSLHCGGEITTDDANWYDVDDDMRDVSKQFPNLVFAVICTGDSMEDTWTEYFCNGRSACSYLEWVPEDREFLFTGVSSDIKAVYLTAEERKRLRAALEAYSEERLEENSCTSDKEIIQSNMDCVRANDALYNKLKGYDT